MIRLIAMLGMVGIVGAQDVSTTSERHTGRRAVIVDVLVRNKTGPVTGLMKDDFTLQDKGKPQQIEIFAAVDARNPSAKPAPPSPLIGYNKVTRQGDPVKAATVILYDRLNTPPADQAYVRKQVLAALKALKETDVFAFYSLGRSLTPVHDFTEDPTTLIHAATRLSAEPPQPPPDDRAEQTMQKALDEALQTQQNIDMLFRAAATAQAFQSITRHLSGLPGRKSVAWVTRTFPLTFGANVDRRGELDKELNAARITLQEENIALYPINPAGVGKGYTDTITSNTDQAQEGHLLAGANASIDPTAGTLSDNSTLEDIAHATGGVAFYNINDITSKLREVLDDGELTYTLGYYPDNKLLDGKVHDFGIRVKASGAILRFRRKYLATKEDWRRQTPPIPELAGDPLEATAITLVAAAQADPAHNGVQKVDVSVNLNDLTLNHDGDHWTGAFEMGLSINGSMGASGRMKVYNLNLTDDQLHQAQKGLIVSNTIDTVSQPGSLRAIVRDKTSGAAGVVHVPLAAK